MSIVCFAVTLVWFTAAHYFLLSLDAGLWRAQLLRLRLLRPHGIGFGVVWAGVWLCWEVNPKPWQPRFVCSHWLLSPHYCWKTPLCQLLHLVGAVVNQAINSYAQYQALQVHITCVKYPHTAI